MTASIYFDIDIFHPMYAIIATGGKQYRVSKGDVIRVEKFAAEAGQAITFDKVLLIENEGDLNVGTPYLEKGKVAGEVVAHGRGKKIEVLKFRRRKSYLRRQGHRQSYTDVRITEISQ